jgi:prepilin-type N-terminal cleavage/methylation domain-containing protein
MKMKRFSDSNDGFTMLELMVALTVLALGLLALMGMQVSAIKKNAWANRFSMATTLAQDKIEEVRWQYYDEITKVAKSEKPIDCTDEYTAFGVTFHRSCYLIPSFETDKYVTIDVEVSWTDRGKKEYKVNMSSQVGFEYTKY